MIDLYSRHYLINTLNKTLHQTLTALWEHANPSLILITKSFQESGNARESVNDQEIADEGSDHEKVLCALSTLKSLPIHLLSHVMLVFRLLVRARTLRR